MSENSINMWTDEKYINGISGYCCYSFNQDHSRAVIYNLYIYPEYRRKGKARKLLQSAIDEIKSIGNYKGEIEIQIDPREGSINLKALRLFYTSLGLKILE